MVSNGNGEYFVRGTWYGDRHSSPWNAGSEPATIWCGHHGVVGSQLRRAALSIPANIAEGCGKSSRKEVIRFFQIASASATETESHLQVAADLGYLPPKASQYAMAETRSIQRMLAGLMRNLP